MIFDLKKNREKPNSAQKRCEIMIKKSFLVLAVVVALPVVFRVVVVKPENSFSAVTKVGGTWKETHLGLSIDLSGISSNQFDLERLNDQTNFWSLNIDRSDFSSEQFKALRSQPQFSEFSAYSNQRFNSLIELSSVGPNLQVINLNFCPIGDEGIESVPKFKNLSVLSIAYSLITDESAQLLAGINSLRSLDLQGTTISDEFLKKFCSRESSLETLRIGSTEISSKGLVHLVKLKKLKRLSLSGTGITDENVELLSQLPLVKLELNSCSISDEGVKKICSIDSLISLAISRTGVTENCLADLCKMPCLSELHISGNGISVEAAKLYGLEELIRGPF